MQFDPTQTVLAGVATQTLQTWLAQAQQALADLMIGGKPVTVTVTGGGQHREVTFQKTDIGQLNIWIRMLQAQLGLVPASRRAIRTSYS